jgi:hypothetical protein
VGTVLASTLRAFAGPPAGSAGFAADLARIDATSRSGGISGEKLEDDYLALLAKAVSGEERGLVYAHIGLMYTWLGPQACDVTEAYCREALRYPLPLPVQARVRIAICGAIRERYREWNGSRLLVARRIVADCWLDALRFLLDNGAPKTPVKGPVPTLFHIVGDSAAVERRIRDQRAAEDKADALNELHECRETVIKRLVSEYRRVPEAPDELRDLATKALPKHPEVVNEIMDRLKTGK